MPVHEQLDEKTKDQLFNEVKETVAKTTNLKDQKKKTFTVQDMWNRQRQAKSASAMMRRWNLN
ncbi:MAG TPA: hypothetical protein VFH07_01455, partial [Chitinophagaceae bacterium]|nr:hypothetical protein [Chitinophagaceae bacterium]